MHGFIHIAALNWVLVNIFNLLPHHILALNQLWMHPFLPKLIGTIIFVGFFVKSQLIQNLPDIVFGKILNQFFCRP